MARMPRMARWLADYPDPSYFGHQRRQFEKVFLSPLNITQTCVAQ